MAQRDLIESTGKQLLKDLYADLEEKPRPGTGKHARHWTMNPYESANRTKKAYALAAKLHQHGFTATEVELGMTDELWEQLAAACKVNKPSAETVKLAIEALRQMDRPRLSKEEVARAFRRCGA
jgi:hypothetical protein